MPPSPLPNAPAPPLWEVFLSSTIKDFEDYRLKVQEVLLHEAEAVVLLSEH